MSLTTGAKALLLEAIQAHKAYAADKPWMKSPRPICVDVADLESLLDEITRLRKTLLCAVCQNEHEMLMTGEECRACRKALEL